MRSEGRMERCETEAWMEGEDRDGSMDGGEEDARRRRGWKGMGAETGRSGFDKQQQQ